MLCLADSQAAVREKTHEIGTILGLSCARIADHINESQELFARWKLQASLSKLYARKTRSRIVESGTGADCLIEDRSQRANAVVDDARRVSLLIATEPNFAIAWSYLAYVRVK